MSDLYSVFPALVPSASEIMAAELLVKQVLEAKYPDLDLREGTGLRDLVLRPNAYALALQKKANDYYFATNTLSGVNDTTDETIINDILSNWFMSRHTGVSAVISARLYFAVQKNVTVPVSTFFSTDNVLRFFPSTTQTFPVGSFTYDAYQNEWYVDVQLVAAAAGTNYNIGSGSLLYFTNFDPYFLHAEISYLSQSATDPETNLQFITRSASAISTRNLINIPSVASNLQTNFNTLKRLVTVGMGDSDMIRDQIKVLIDPEDPRYLTGLSRTSTVASATLVEHGFYTGQIVNIVGCLPSGYNGQYSITVVDYQTFTFSVSGSPGVVTALPTVQSYTSPCLVHTGGKVDVYLGDSVSSTIVQLTTDVSGRAQITGPVYALSRSSVTGGVSDDTIPYVAAVAISGSVLDVAGSAIHITTTGSHGLINGSLVSVSGIIQTKVITTLNCVNLVVTAVSAGHGLSTGAIITVSGVTPITYNGTFTITVIDANTFVYVLSSNVLVAGSGTMLMTNTSVNGSFAITYTGTNTFDVILPTVWPGATNTITALAITTHVTYTVTNPYLQTKTLTSLSGTGTTVTATLNNHGYAANRYVTISGATPSYYNGTFKIASVLGPTQFTFNIGSTILASATGTITCKSTIPWQDYGFSDSQLLYIDFGSGYGSSTASFQTQYFNNVDPVQQYLTSPTNRVLCGDYISRGFNLYVLDLSVVVYNTTSPSTGLVQDTAKTYLATLAPGATFVLSELVSALTTAGVANIQTPLGVSYTYYHRDLVPVTTGNVVDYLDPLDKTNVFLLGNVTTSSLNV